MVIPRKERTCHNKEGKLIGLNRNGDSAGDKEQQHECEMLLDQGLVRRQSESCEFDFKINKKPKSVLKQ